MFALRLTSPLSQCGSCLTSCSVLSLSPPPPGLLKGEQGVGSELESGSIWLESSIGSCLIVGGEIVFVTPHFFTSLDNLSVNRGKED